MVDVSADDILDTLRSGLLVLDGGLRVRSANRAFYRTFAVEPDQTIGRLVYELGNGQWDIGALRILLGEIIPRDNAVEAFEVEHEFPGIGPKIMLLNARKVFRPGNNVPFLLLAIDDVTETREAQRERERQRLLAQNIVDTVRDPLVVLESDMTIVEASRAFQRLFDLPPEQVIGHSLYDLAQGQWKVPRLQELLSKIVPDDTAMDGFEVEDEFPDLGRRIFKLNARKVIRPGNHAMRLLLVMEDVTEERLRERHRELLAAELSHRIKNSLQIITSFVAFEIRRAAEPCKEGYRAMQARIAAVAQLYDVISRSATLGPVPVGQYLEGIASSLRSSMLDDSSKVSIKVDVEPLAIGADHAVPVGLIVNELATNAVKYAFPTGTGEIVLNFRRRDGEVVLIVSDSGAGMNKSAGGTVSAGLGSRFIEAFVRQLGGTLAVATGEGGSTFTVRLPQSILA